MSKWKIYHEDGTTFDSTQGQPWDAPAYGVMCIGQGLENGTNNIDNGHWYIWRTDLQSWLSIKTQDGMNDQWAHFACEIPAVLFGRVTLRSTFNAARKRMVEDLNGYR